VVHDKTFTDLINSWLQPVSHVAQLTTSGYNAFLTRLLFVSYSNCPADPRAIDSRAWTFRITWEWPGRNRHYAS
jgi:hypothetical protein